MRTIPESFRGCRAEASAKAGENPRPEAASFDPEEPI
jgi:hypothetical protein